MQQRDQGVHACIRQTRRGIAFRAEQSRQKSAQALLHLHGIGDAAFDSVHLIKAANPGDVSGLARPGADRTEPGHDPQDGGIRGLRAVRQAIIEQRSHACFGIRAQWLRRQHHMKEAGLHIGHRRFDRLQGGQQALLSEFGDGGAAAQDEGVGHAAPISRGDSAIIGPRIRRPLRSR